MSRKLTLALPFGKYPTTDFLGNKSLKELPPIEKLELVSCACLSLFHSGVTYTASFRKEYLIFNVTY